MLLFQKRLIFLVTDGVPFLDLNELKSSMFYRTFFPCPSIVILFDSHENVKYETLPIIVSFYKNHIFLKWYSDLEPLSDMNQGW